MAAFIVHQGKIYPVMGQAKMNGMPAVIIRDEHGIMTIPLAIVKVPQKPVLVCKDGVRL